MIRWGEPQAFIRALVWNEIGEEERNVLLTAEKKQFFKNGKAASPNQFLSLPMVLFAPESILLLKESPQERRNYIDDMITNCSPPYLGRLRQYKRALAQRNKVLKDELLPKEEKRRQMALWEGPLLEHGKYIIEERKNWIAKLNPLLQRHYLEVAGGETEANFVYTPNVEALDFSEKQKFLREEELERGLTLVGPHRDDFIPSLDERPLRSFGSQGEFRTFTLALKLAEITLLKEVLRFSPFLLLDDVLSELDEGRCRFFFSHLKNFDGQIFATATSFSLFPKTSLVDYQGWLLKEGEIAPL